MTDYLLHRLGQVNEAVGVLKARMDCRIAPDEVLEEAVLNIELEIARMETAIKETHGKFTE